MKNKILKLLETNSRYTVKDLAAMLGAEEIEVAAAIAEMEADKIICGYHTMIDWDKVDDESVTALIEVKVTPQRGKGFDTIAERIYNYEEVNAIYLMAGSFDFTVIIQGRTMKEVSRFVSDKLAVLDTVVGTQTHFVMKKYKDHGIIFGADKKDERLAIVP